MPLALCYTFLVTGQAARTLNLPRFSLDFLLRHYCGITTDKRFQLADWRVRPLPKEMMYYAQVRCAVLCDRPNRRAGGLSLLVVSRVRLATIRFDANVLDITLAICSQRLSYICRQTHTTCYTSMM